MISLTLLCIIPGKRHHLPNFFSMRIISVVFFPHCLMSKIVLFGNLWGIFLLKYLFTHINSPRSPLRILPASPPVSGCILSAALLWKNRSMCHHLQKIFSARESSPNVQNRALWKPLLDIRKIPSHEYQQSLITPVNHASITTCRQLRIARWLTMYNPGQSEKHLQIVL